MNQSNQCSVVLSSMYVFFEGGKSCLRAPFLDSAFKSSRRMEEGRRGVSQVDRQSHTHVVLHRHAVPPFISFGSFSTQTKLSVSLGKNSFAQRSLNNLPKQDQI